METKEFICKHCYNQFNFASPQAAGAHVVNCSKNPKRAETCKNISKALCKPKVNFDVKCQGCGEIFTAEVIEDDRISDRLPRFCSRTCANTHVISDEQKQKVLQTYLKKAGLPLDIKERVQQRRAEGVTAKQVAKEFGLKPALVSKWTSKLPGLKRAPYARREPQVQEGNDSYAKIVEGQELSRDRKGRIAEAAVMFRLSLLDIKYYQSPFDGDKVDFLVETPRGRKIVQVRWARQNKQGPPSISLVCYEGHYNRRKYKDSEFDFIVGYDLSTDTAYVYTREEVRNHQTMFSVGIDGAERWDKLERIVL